MRLRALVCGAFAASLIWYAAAVIGRSDRAETQGFTAAQITAVSFQDGGAQFDGAITEQDPIDPLSHKPCRVYALTMSAGHMYVIVMKAQNGGGSLRLQDTAGNIVDNT